MFLKRPSSASNFSLVGRAGKLQAGLQRALGRSLSDFGDTSRSIPK